MKDEYYCRKLENVSPPRKENPKDVIKDVITDSNQENKFLPLFIVVSM